MPKTETLRLVGGDRSGERVSVAVGLPWVRMPRREPLPNGPMAVPATAQDHHDLYVRRVWRTAPDRREEFFVLKDLSDTEAEAIRAGLS